MTNLTFSFAGTESAVPAFTQGLALSLGLIVAIGAQNAFVLRQGLRREYVGSIVLFCAVCDALLIAAGVFGMSAALGERPLLTKILSLAGAVFLATYGYQALRRVTQSNQLRPAEAASGMRRISVLLQAAAFTLLNPHVYLDTVVLLGAIAQQFGDAGRWWFCAGACLASLSWFSALGFGARPTSPRFTCVVCRRCLLRQRGVVYRTGLRCPLASTFFCSTTCVADSRRLDWSNDVGAGAVVDRASDPLMCFF